MRARAVVALAVALIGAAVLAGPAAAALEPGVHVDPGSPAGKEYTAPLSALRGLAAGQSVSPGQGEQPLFGIGITPAVATASSAAHRRGSAHPTHSGSAGGKASAPQGPGGATSGNAAGGNAARTGAATERALAELTRPGSSTPAIALVGALVVLGGLGLGVLIVAATRRLA